MEEFSKSGRRLRPRKSSTQSREAGGEKVGHSARERSGGAYGSGERREYRSGERRSFGSGERREYGSGERRSFGSGERRESGPRRNGFQDRNGRPGRPDRAPRKPGRRFGGNADEGINRMINRKGERDFEARAAAVVEQKPQEEIRLNRFIANSGVCSRREADTYIQAGLVTVNGEVVNQLGTKVNVLNDEVRFNGERLKGEEKVYIVMNKPKGYVTSASDPHADKTVMELLKSCTSRVYPVGRLDKATTGVLLFTNDGEMSERLTHPSYEKKKIYQVTLDKDLSRDDYDKILSGLQLQDGEIRADELEYIDENDHRKLGIEIHSGRNRIVRRIFESLGYGVKTLDRVYFAGLTKKGLKKGEWRYLSQGEVNILKMGAYA